MEEENKKVDEEFINAREELINMRVALEKGLHEKYMQTRETFWDFVRRKIRELKMP